MENKMSRTYRKKDGYGFEAYDYIWVDDCYLQKQYYSPNTKEYVREKAKFHRDGKAYGGGVPRVFRNELERAFRGGTKKELKKWKDDESHEVMVPQFRHTAGWYYW
jgi:hypothetical protein